jgi:hypothetical protein
MTQYLPRARRLGTVLCTAALAVSSALVSGAPATAAIPDDPPNDRIVIEVVTVNGSGCPRRTAAIAVAPDNTAFTVTYSQYMAQVGVGSKPTDFRKNCQINVRVHVPQGFTFAIARVDYRGFASLAKGAKAQLRASYYFQGNGDTDRRTHGLGSPFEDNWQASDHTDIASLIFRPCGADRLFNINTELRVDKGSSDVKKTTSFIAMDSTDGSIKTVYHFHWKRCTN